MTSRRSGISVISSAAVESRHAARQRARRDDRVLEADHLLLVAADPDAARVLEGAPAADDLHALGLGDGREPAREFAHDALGLPLSQRVERDARLAEVQPELLRALRLADDGSHMEQRLRW